MKLLKHSPERDDDEAGRRHYLTPLGRLPSVTTILQATQNKPGLDQWRRDQGASAERSTAQGRARGAAFHKEMEDYLNANRRPTVGSEYFDSVGHFLRRISDVALVEGAIWHGDGYAGSVDCIAVVDGTLSVIDWKTAKRPKQDWHVDDEHLQVAAYRAAAQDVYSIAIRRAFVVFALADSDAQVFETPLDTSWLAFTRRLRAYQSRCGVSSDARSG